MVAHFGVVILNLHFIKSNLTKIINLQNFENSLKIFKRIHSKNFIFSGLHQDEYLLALGEKWVVGEVNVCSFWPNLRCYRGGALILISEQ